MAAPTAYAYPNNQAAVLHAVDDLRVQPHPLQGTLLPGQALIRISHVGICASDVHYLKHGSCGHFVLNAPMVIGHESAGEVVSIGDDVIDIAVGDLVALEPGVPCRQCSFCKEGKYNLCPDMKFFATPPVDGSLAHYITHPAFLCFKIPSPLTTVHGALCEPLSVGIHACRRADVGKSGDGKNSIVAILGAGPIGLVTAAVAIANGAAATVITDINEDRLVTARKLFPVIETVLVKDKSPEESAGLIKQGLSSRVPGAHDGSPDVVLDCCGFEHSMRTAISCVKSGGKILLVGCGQNEMKLPLTSASQREVDVLGLFRYRDTYPTALDLMASGRVNIDDMVTHRYERIEEVKGIIAKLSSLGWSLFPS